MPVMPGDLERVGDHVESELEATRPAEAKYADLEFPQMVIDDLLEAGRLRDDQLMRRIIAAAYTLAARTGSGTPAEVLDAALAKVAFGEKWAESVGPRVRKLFSREGELRLRARSLAEEHDDVPDYEGGVD
jgi:hypothetical protein